MSNLVPGTFRGRATEAALGFTKGNKEQVAVMLEVLDGDFVGERITWYGYFTEKTTARTMESLRLCGWTGDDLSDLSSINGTADVDIVVAMDEYDGQQNLKVDWINQAGGRPLALKDPMGDAQKKAFAARMKGAAIAARGAAPAAKSPAKAPAQRPAPSQHPNASSSRGVDDSDIPF